MLLCHEFQNIFKSLVCFSLFAKSMIFMIDASYFPCPYSHLSLNALDSFLLVETCHHYWIRYHCFHVNISYFVRIYSKNETIKFYFKDLSIKTMHACFAILIIKIVTFLWHTGKN